MILSRVPVRVSALAPAFLAIALTGCTPVTRIEGNYLPFAKAEQLKAGMQREEVETLLGTPTLQSTFDDQTYIWVGQRTEQEAFFKPETTDRQVLTVRFDNEDKVAKIERLGLDDGGAVDPVGRQTPSSGRELSFIEQLLGNVGRFPAQDLPGSDGRQTPRR